MAQATPVNRTLQIQTQAGTLANGQPKVQRHNFSHVSVDAVDDDILAVGQALAALMADPLLEIVRVDQTSLAADTTTSSGGTTTSSGTGGTATTSA